MNAVNPFWRFWAANEDALDQAQSTGVAPAAMWAPQTSGGSVYAVLVPERQFRSSLGDYGTTEAERKFCGHPRNWITCDRIHSAMVWTDQAQSYYWTKKELAAGRVDGRPDAWRHCTWIGVLSTRVSDASARAEGQRHEQTPRPKAVQSRRHYDLAKTMDLHNNEIGITEGNGGDPEFNQFDPSLDKAGIANYLTRRCFRRATEPASLTNLWWLLPRPNFPDGNTR